MTEENAYETPQSDQEAPVTPTSIGSFALVFLIIDLVLIAISVFGVVTSLLLPAELMEATGVSPTMTNISILIGLGIIFIGGSGDIGMLMKKKWAAALCYSSLIFVVASIILGFLQLEQTTALAQDVPGAESIVIVTAVVTALLRVGYSIAYVFAVKSGAKNISLMESAQ